MDLFKKKFRVRVSYFTAGKYTVDYAHYKFIPVWYSLNFWFSQSLTGNTECWSTHLMDIKEAEDLAKKLNSIEDVKEYYKPMEKEREEFYKDKEEYYKKCVPYTTKEFKK